MAGIVGDLFDLDGDGKLDIVEQTEELIHLDRLLHDDDSDSEDSFDDYGGSSDYDDSF